jgi:hypothetical protein
MKGNSRSKKFVCTYLVFPSAHSTHPSSVPNVNVGVRISSGDRPSSLKDSFKAVKRNSRSGIEGEGGLILSRTICRNKNMCAQKQSKHLTTSNHDGPSYYT